MIALNYTQQTATLVIILGTKTEHKITGPMDQPPGDSSTVVRKVILDKHVFH